MRAVFLTLLGVSLLAGRASGGDAAPVRSKPQRTSAVCQGGSCHISGGGAGDHVGTIAESIAAKQAAIKQDNVAIANDQAALSRCQNQDRSVPYCNPAQQQLAKDQNNLKVDTDDLRTLEALLTGPATVQGGSGQSIAVDGAKAIAISASSTADDIAKLQGPVAAPAPGVEGFAAAPSASDGARTASMIATPFAQRASASEDLLDKRVVIPSGPAAMPSSARPESRSGELVRSAAEKLKLGDAQGALQDALQAIKDDPSNPLGYLRAAEAYNKLGDYVNGERMARASIQRDPNNPQAWKALAWALLKQGKYKEALEAALQAAKLKPDMAEAWAIAAYAAERLGNHAAAVDYLKRAADIDPRFKDQLEAALRGEKVFADDYDDALYLGGAGKRGRPWGGLAGGALGAFMISGAVWFWRRRRAAAGTARVPGPLTQRENGVSGAVGKYQLGQLIGRGGMGEVFLATDSVLDRQVAVKKMTRTLSELGPRAREQFMTEARTVAQLHHPAIVDIYDVVESGDDVFLVFELVRGKTAMQLLAESGKIPFARALEILSPVCEALDYAHGRQLVHRDLKPANVIVTEQGRIKLMDFGIARSLADAGARQPTALPGARTPGVFARTRHAVGTPAYMAPEAETGVIRKEGDVYSLGVTLYEMLTGQLPYGALATAAEKTSARFAPASSLAPSLPRAVDEVIARALKAEPRERFRSAGEFIVALRV